MVTEVQRLGNPVLARDVYERVLTVFPTAVRLPPPRVHAAATSAAV